MLIDTIDKRLSAAEISQGYPSAERILDYPLHHPLLGEYVVEILEDIHVAMSHFDQAAYASFVRQNREVMRAMRARATSYWNVYYRQTYPDGKSYPAIASSINWMLGQVSIVRNGSTSAVARESALRNKSASGATFRRPENADYGDFRNTFISAVWLDRAKLNMF
ncbi:hypothetical protein PYH37_002670 [Sinorhizobium numidicum]|uniref:Uncharacterized protein n=1 Tax=Sinorhizobium numidicum TaxID=680248 RepID=A0ABY8D0S9_9HYPH|nr:hypothetical protein [Sinorhizobium numidicum]WEX77840.1 hypothetical protein PYH37_002670 [Sinorhizobium numidicum]WEX84499.1 hypothetical protein PYH38_003383 [Sinorhizobium numidicum]